MLGRGLPRRLTLQRDQGLGANVWRSSRPPYGLEACSTLPNSALWCMSRLRETKVVVAVTYSDGRTAYIRVGPQTARHGAMTVIDVARERQEAGEIPDGTIVSVQQVR